VKFLANENFPGPSFHSLKAAGIDIIWIANSTPGISDSEVIALAVKESRTILTHDSDYGELIFKYGHRPTGGIIYFKLIEFLPDDPAKILLELIEEKHDFKNRLTVVERHSIRERKY